MVKSRLFDSVLLEKIRERFEYVEVDHLGNKRIYFENAGGALTLKSLSEVYQVACIPDNSGRQNESSRHIDEILRKGNEDAARVFNNDSGSILAGESTTSNIFRIFDVITSNVKGTNIVCTNLDHASMFDAATYFANKHGLELRIAQLDIKTGAVPSKAITAQVDDGTVAVAFIHASNVTGVKNDIDAITTEVRRKSPNTFIIADGAQHVQHCVIDVKKYDVDAYLIAAYKMFSKVGLTFSYLSDRLAVLPHWKLAGKPEKCWDLGTRDASGYAAFTAAVDYLCWLAGQVGCDSNDRRKCIEAAFEAIESHEMALTDLMFNGNANQPGLLGIEGVTVYGYPMVTDKREAVFAINLSGLPAKEFVQKSVTAGIVVHDRQSDAYTKHTLQAMGTDQCVRVSLGHYNTPDEILTFLRLVKKFRDEIGG